MRSKQLAELTQSQRDRLAYIELCVRFNGEIRRLNLVTRFGIQSAAATRDLALYKDLAPNNIDYDTKRKSYVLGSSFQAIFEMSAERVLSWLSQGFGDGEPVKLESGVSCAIPSRLSQPDLETLAHITRAIHHECPLKITYHSTSIGESVREIVPFALVDSGLRWHLRAFDRSTKEFWDFLVTRIKHPIVMINDSVLPHEKSDQDIQWTRIVEVELIPHPDQPNPEITEIDYNMVDGVLKIKLRAATAGYILHQWRVDCSLDHRLREYECRLWLKDNLALYGVKSAKLAPGYIPISKADI